MIEWGCYVAKTVEFTVLQCTLSWYMPTTTFRALKRRGFIIKQWFYALVDDETLMQTWNVPWTTYAPSNVSMWGSPADLHDCITVVSTIKTCSMTMRDSWISLRSVIATRLNFYDQTLHAMNAYITCRAIFFHSFRPCNTVKSTKYLHGPPYKRFSLFWIFVRKCLS